MSNALLLDNFLRESGKSKTFLAKKLNVSRPSIYYLLSHPENCTYGQAEILCKELSIVKKIDQDNIFLPKM